MNIEYIKVGNGILDQIGQNYIIEMVDKERNQIVTCLSCKHCLPPSERINGELCSLKIENKDAICWNSMTEEEKSNFMDKLRINCPISK